MTTNKSNPGVCMKLIIAALFFLSFNSFAYEDCNLAPDTSTLRVCLNSNKTEANENMKKSLKARKDLMPDTVALRKLVAAQDAFTVFMNAECKSRSDAFRGGSQEQIIKTGCEVELLRMRIKHLNIDNGAL